MEIAKAWGHEDVIVNDRLFGYCGKILHLREGWQCSLHFHPRKHETFRVLSGCVRFELGSGTYVLNPGESLAVEPGVAHRFTGVTDARIIEVSSFHDEADVVRLEPSRALDEHAGLG